MSQPGVSAGTENDEFGADDFEAEIYFPYAPAQQWVVLSSEFTEAELAVYTFTMAHLNPHTGKFDANFGRKRVAERFKRSLDWVDDRLKGLVKKGAMTKVPTWWVDANDHSKGRVMTQLTPDGRKRAQAPNRYRVRMAPPGGAAYPGPIKIAEFYSAKKIADRLEAAGQGGAAVQPPPSDQGKQEVPAGSAAAGTPDQQEEANQQVTGGAAVQRPPQPTPNRPRGPLCSGPKDHGSGKTTGGKTTGEGSAADPSLRSGSLPSEEPGQPESVVATELELPSNPLHAHARANAGPEAVRAVRADPKITTSVLASVIQQHNPGLTAGQALGRAAMLLEWELAGATAG